MVNNTSIHSSMSSHKFWQSVNILITKFNVINKRLWSTNILDRRVCESKTSDWVAPLKTISKLSNEDFVGYLQNMMNKFELNVPESECNSYIDLLVLELLPRNFTEEKEFQLVCLCKQKLIATFYNISPENTNTKNVHCLCPNFTYSLALENHTVTLRADTDSSSKSYKWLSDTVLPQFVKWGKDDNIKHTEPLCKASLQLISADRYYKKYNELKLKYGKEMVENWPEGTDPSKYVYEDVAIATYLLLLWKDDKETPERKTFVDLGCGNGLLVYILTKEGHNGIGIDVRKRQIWNLYPKDITLEVKTIVPSDSNLFPDADWLIGNHSDELTPWIPVIAAKSSYKCKFFVLPCCAYNFDGTKYQRKDSSKSQYTEYIEYVRTICDTCGFETSIDRLKIPSTKRICLVGQKRTYSKEKLTDVGLQIQDFIDKGSANIQDNHTAWVSDFHPRNAIERVRNCTQIDQTVIDNVINCVSKYLLEECELQSKWSAGQEVNINDLVTLLPEDNLKAMKAECGGLQTLLKNNHHIFKVKSGKVQLRYPRTIDEVYNSNHKIDRSKTKVQQKPCWFYKNHPQGCPLTDTTCSYLHVVNYEIK